MRRLGAGALPLVLLSLGACSKSCKNDHPYVPYAIDGGSGAATKADDAAAPIEVRGPVDAGSVASLAPSEDGQTIVLGATTLQAPAGMTFGLSALAHLCGGGQDLLAFVRSKERSRALPGVYLAGSCTGGQLKPLLSEGVDIQDPSCSAEFVVTPLGAGNTQTAFVDQRVVCAGHSGFAQPRRVALVGWSAGQISLRFVAQLTEAPGAGRLGLIPSVRDLDADGIVDLSLSVQAAEPLPGVGSLQLRFYDRPAGPTRDPDEPARSAMEALRALEGRVSKDPEGALRGAAQLRELLRAVCAEGGAPAVSLPSGPLTCGIGPVLGGLLSLRIRAYLQQGDAVSAAAVLREAERGVSVYDAKKRGELAAQFRRGLALRELPPPRSLPAVVGPAPRGPALAPMSFDERGGLVFRDETGPRRWDPDSDAIDATAAAQIDAAGKLVTKDGSLRLIEVYDPCDGGRLRATLAPTGAGEPRDIVLPLDADFGARCVRHGPEIPVLALGEGARGLEVLAQGRRVLLPLRGGPGLAVGLKTPVEGVTPGGAASPDGQVIALPHGAAVLIAAAGKTPALHEGQGAVLSRCVVANQATHVACVQDAKLVVFRLRP